MDSPGDSGLELLVLGQTELRVQDETIPIARPLQRALAVRLALARGHGVPDDMLADDLWGEGEVDRPAERLRVLTYRLRQALGEHAGALRRTANGYALTGRLTDLTAAEEALGAVQAARRTGDTAGLRAAAAHGLSQWRGPAFADLRGTPFGSVQAARLDGLQRDLKLTWLEAELAHGTPVATEADELLTADPMNERLVRLAAVALYRDGRQADALQRIAGLRTALAEEIGIDPSGETAELELRILRQDPELMPATEQPPAPVWSRPDETTSFIGRESELAFLVDRLTEPGVITLTGGPGVGKTRLAREVAEAVRRSGRPVVWLDVARLNHPDAVVPDLAAAAGVQPGADDPLPLCVRQLAGAVLVIDNAEHLVDAVAAMLTAIRRPSTGLSALVTSQLPLRISGEEVHPVGPLGRDAAITLFRARSGTHRGEHDDLVDEICAAVDRLPLAIELAAGLTRTLTLEQLGHRIGHRLRLLTGGSRDAGRRHGSLRAAIDWSHTLLDPTARQLLHRLAVFAGGGTLEAIEQVAAGGDLDPADIAAALTELHDRSLVTLTPGHRFGLLETVRDYALEQLRSGGDENAVRRRHADWCAEVAARTSDYGGPDHVDLLRELDAEEANLRAAVEWALGPGGEPDRVLGIAAATWWYWWSRGHMAEGRGWLHRALAAGDPAPTPERAAALRATASLTRNSGDAAGARELGEEALRIYRDLDSDEGCVATLVGLCITSLALRDFDTALRQGQEAADRARPMGNPRLLATAVNVTGGALRGLGRTTEAERRFTEACDLWRAVDDRRGLAGTLGNLGLVHLQQDRPDRARELCLQALRLYRDLDLTEGMLDQLELIAGLEVKAGRPAAALRLLTTAAAERVRIGAPLIIADELDARNEAEAAARAAAADPPPAPGDVVGLVDELLRDTAPQRR